jgi:hypothetical protein
MGAETESLHGSELARNVALSLGQAGLINIATTVYEHRQLTHDSVKLKPVPKMLSRLILMGTGVKPRIWADVHRTHHSYTDVNMGPILETADFLEWAATNPDRISPDDLPETFPISTLDPAAELSLDDVRKIGGATRELVKDRYVAPLDYSEDDVVRLLDTSTPRFQYEDKPRRFGKSGRKRTTPEPIPEGSVHNLFPELRDPHSPPLHKGGILGILHENVFRYQELAKYHEGNHDDKSTVSTHADKLDEALFDKPAVGLIGIFAGNIALQVALNKDRSAGGIARSGLKGSLVALGAISFSIWGGKVTNAFGHAGQDIVQGLREGKPRVMQDGTYASDFPLLSPPTLDEVGGQKEHHERPWARAYTHETGWKGFKQAPFGTLVDYMARKGVLWDKGDQFGHPEVEEVTRYNREDIDYDGYIRPDSPTLAVRLLEDARARTIMRQQSEIQ